MPWKVEDKIEPVKLFFVSTTPEGCDETLAPIIFIPGFFSSNRTFAGVRYKISKRTKRKIYSIDLRNHGKSEYSESFSLQHMLVDLENFMEEQNISKAVLAGHSMGGKLALAMALKHPEKVEKLVVEDIPVIGTKAQNEEFLKSFMHIRLLTKKVAELPKELSEKEAQLKLIPLVAKSWSTAVDNITKNMNFIVPIHKTPEGTFEWNMNMKVLIDIPSNFDMLEIDLSSNPVYHGETLLLAGEKSLTHVQDTLDDFRKYFPKVECKIIDNGFHTYHLEFPDLYVKLVSKFFGA